MYSEVLARAPRSWKASWGAPRYRAGVSRVQEHHNLRRHSPLLMKTCVRQVVLDKWFPLTVLEAARRGARRGVGRPERGPHRPTLPRRAAACGGCPQGPTPPPFWAGGGSRDII